MSTGFWQNYSIAHKHMCGWWRRQELVVFLTAPKDHTADLPPPMKPANVAQQWTDSQYRLLKAEYEIAHTYYGADAFPIFEAHLGPGNLATFIGSEPAFAETTVWYKPCWPDPPEDSEPLVFDPENRWFLTQRDIVDAGVKHSLGRYLVGMPDLIENIDIFASLRDSQKMMLDLVDRPEFVLQKVREINQVWFAAFQHLHELIKDSDGGNAWTYFKIYGPGKTGKLQCDASAMISPRMFKKFVVPVLTEQCDWLDYSMFHLDGTDCMGHLDHLLDIPSLTAIEWTPEPKADRPGGHPDWYDLYRRILDAGKAVHAWDVAPEYVVPLLDAVGGKGMLLRVVADSEEQAQQLEEQIAQFRA